MKITCPVCGNKTEQPRCEQCGFVTLADIVNTRDLFAELMRCAEQRRAELVRRAEQNRAQRQALMKEVQDLTKRLQQHSEAEQALNAERHRLVEVLQAIAEEKQSKEAGEALLPTIKTVGSIVTYGQYPQDADGTKRPIEWIVLACDAEKGQLLLISKYGLDEKQYDHKAPCRTWKKSDIRKWLNGKFLQEAFTPEEKKRIVTAKLNTTGYDGNSGGEDTEDRIWLLSWQEAKKYFRSNDDRKTTETDYAHANADWKPLSHRGSWWLRASGDSINNASFVDGGGSFFSISGPFVGDIYLAVRPAMILDLSAV